jgi:hypothetical protein
MAVIASAVKNIDNPANISDKVRDLLSSRLAGSSIQPLALVLT